MLFIGVIWPSIKARLMKTAVLAIGIIALIFLPFEKVPLPCYAKLSWQGNSITQQQQGFLVYTENSFGDPLVAGVNLRGAGDFKFHFSSDVHRIRLSSGSSVFYEGPPLESHRALPGFLSIEMQRNGSLAETWVEVADSCSIGSFGRSLFK